MVQKKQGSYFKDFEVQITMMKPVLTYFCRLPTTRIFNMDIRLSEQFYCGMGPSFLPDFEQEPNYHI